MLNLEQQIYNQLEKAKNILIAFSNQKGGDALSSALALSLILKKKGKAVDVVAPDDRSLREVFAFLPESEDIGSGLSNLRRFVVSVDISQAKVSQIRYSVENNQLNFIISPSEGWFKPEDVSAKAGEFKYDLIIIIGSADLESLGPIYDQNVEFFYKTNIINIDNHSGNEEFGQINFIDLNAASVSEIIFYLIKNYDEKLIDEDAATCLLAGIIQATRNFKTANLTPRTLLGTSELISFGARREEIVNHLYRSRDLSTLKLWGRILNNLKSEAGGSLIWSQLSHNDFADSQAAESGVEEIIDELVANVPGAKLIAILSEVSASKTNLILYSFRGVNALEMVKEYKPQGNIRLARVELDKDLGTANTEIIPELKAKLDKLKL